MNTVLRYLNRHIHRVGIVTVLGVGAGVIVGLSYAPVDDTNMWIAAGLIATSTLVSFGAGVGAVYLLSWFNPDKQVALHRRSTP